MPKLNLTKSKLNILHLALYLAIEWKTTSIDADMCMIGDKEIKARLKKDKKLIQKFNKLMEEISAVAKGVK